MFFSKMPVIPKKHCIFAFNINVIQKIMETLTIYGIRSEILSKLFTFLSKMAGAKVERKYIATAEEIEYLEKSKASGISTTDFSEFKKHLKSKL